MREHFPYREALAANVASNLVFAINFQNDFRRLFHKTCSAARALVIISLATEFAEQLRAVRVLAFQWKVDYLMARATEKVFIHLVNRRLGQSKHIEALLLFLSGVLDQRRSL